MQKKPAWTNAKALEAAVIGLCKDTNPLDPMTLTWSESKGKGWTNHTTLRVPNLQENGWMAAFILIMFKPVSNFHISKVQLDAVLRKSKSQNSQLCQPGDYPTNSWQTDQTAFNFHCAMVVTQQNLLNPQLETLTSSPCLNWIYDAGTIKACNHMWPSWNKISQITWLDLTPRHSLRQFLPSWQSNFHNSQPPIAIYECRFTFQTATPLQPLQAANNLAVPPMA